MRFNIGGSSQKRPTTFKETAEFLFFLLDDVDTADDLAKDNDNLFRNLVRKAHSRRFEVASTDGYSISWGVDDEV